MEQLVEIREFSSGDLHAASRITEHIWGEECGTLPPDLSRMIYEYLVRYYYVPDSSLSLAAADGENTLRAFLLAAAGEFSHKAADEWAARNCPAEGRGFFNAYRAYLDGNGDAVRRMLKEKDNDCHWLLGERKGSPSAAFWKFAKRGGLPAAE